MTMANTTTPARCVAVLGPDGCFCGKDKDGKNGGPAVRGVVYAEEEEENERGSGVAFFGAIAGLAPGPHGLHVHAAGDLTEGCASACAHFDPDGTGRHGGPDDPDGRRHAGDLGNVRADERGIALVELFGKGLTLGAGGPRSVLGRTLVVHAAEDDLGRYRGRDGEKRAESRKTGNAGARVACGVIGIAAAAPS